VAGEKMTNDKDRLETAKKEEMLKLANAIYGSYSRCGENCELDSIPCLEHAQETFNDIAAHDAEVERLARLDIFTKEQWQEIKWSYSPRFNHKAPCKSCEHPSECIPCQIYERIRQLEKKGKRD
jgi:hypothetical protein